MQKYVCAALIDVVMHMYVCPRRPLVTPISQGLFQLEGHQQASQGGSNQLERIIDDDTPLTASHPPIHTLRSVHTQASCSHTGVLLAHLPCTTAMLRASALSKCRRPASPYQPDALLCSRAGDLPPHLPCMSEPERQPAWRRTATRTRPGQWHPGGLQIALGSMSGPAAVGTRGRCGSGSG